MAGAADRLTASRLAWYPYGGAARPAKVSIAPKPSDRMASPARIELLGRSGKSSGFRLLLGVVGGMSWEAAFHAQLIDPRVSGPAAGYEPKNVEDSEGD